MGRDTSKSGRAGGRALHDPMAGGNSGAPRSIVSEAMDDPLGNGRDLLELVIKLEEARTSGALAGALETPATDGIAPVLESYKRLAGRLSVPTPYRSEHVRSLA